MRASSAPLRAPGGNRRRADLSIPVPLRDPTRLAVPLPLPPLSAPSSASTSSPHPPPPSSAPASSHPPPILLSDLDRLSRIGSGAGGTVYLVRHRPSSRLYALKVIYGHHDDHVLVQIRREIEILRAVNNPFVVRCYAMFDHAGEIQILLEYMDRGSLSGRRFPYEPQLSELSYQILQGLYYLHRGKIVHRDIKPSNILLDSSGRAKIADFGVSRILSQTMDPCNSSVGTIQYMSPERIDTDLNEGSYDGYAADIWSFGISVLELYLGRLPFAEKNVGDWASLMCAIRYSDPPTAPPTSSPEFRSFVSCCLQKEPGKRYTAGKLLQHQFITQHQGNSGVLQPLPLPPLT